MSWFLQLTDTNKIAVLGLVIAILAGIVIPIVLHFRKIKKVAVPQNQLTDVSLKAMIDALTQKKSIPPEELQLFTETLKNLQSSHDKHKQKAVSHLQTGDVDDAALELELALNEQKQLALTANHNLVETLLELATIYNFTDYDKSLDKLLEARQLEPSEPRVLNQLGLLAMRLGKMELAIDALMHLLDIADSSYFKAISLGNLGNAYARLGDVPKAINYLEQALKISIEIGDKQSQGNELDSLGIAYIRLGNVPKAINYLEQALKISVEIGNKEGQVSDLGNLGIAYTRLGNVPKAINHLEQSLKISIEIGDKEGQGNNLGNLGIAYMSLSNVPKAINYLEQALKISVEIGSKQGQGNDLGNLGIAYASLGNVPKSINYLEQSLEINIEIGDKEGQGNNLGNLGSAYARLGDVPKARKFLLDALKIYEEIKSPNQETVRSSLAGL